MIKLSTPHKLSVNKLQKGFSMIEIVLVLMVVFFLIMLITNIPPTLSAITVSKHISLAKDIAGKEVDFLRRQGYDNLTVTEEPATFTDARLQELPQSSAVYEVKSCDIEVCTSGEEVKEIKVQVLWQEAKETKKVELNTLLSKGGVGQ